MKWLVSRSALPDIPYQDADPNPDLEAPVLTDGTEWVDVDESTGSPPAEANALSYAQVASMGHNLRSPNRSAPPLNADGSHSQENGSADHADHQSMSLFGSQALDHKAEVQLIFLAYSRVLSKGQ